MFSFLDQFLDYEVDLSRYLDYIRQHTDYNYRFSNYQPVVTTVKNIFEQVDIINNYKQNMALFEKYKVKDRERIETVAYKFYEFPDLWWVIAVFNDIRSPFLDYPLTNEQLVYVSEFLYENEGRFPKTTYFKLLEEENEKKRDLRILKLSKVYDLIFELQEAVQASNKGIA